MAGTPKWQVRHILFVMILLRLETSVREINRRFVEKFGRVGHGDTEKSIVYVEKNYINHGGYDSDRIFADSNPDAPLGKIGYLMGLHARGLPYAGIVTHIKERFPNQDWPLWLKKKNEPIEVAAIKAVEIAVITYHEYAGYAGKTSLMDKYRSRDEFVPNWVITRHRFFPPEYIFALQKTLQLPDGTGNWLPPVVLPYDISFDEIIFILTRFVDGFANSYRLPNPMAVVQMAPMMYGSGAVLYDQFGNC